MHNGHAESDIYVVITGKIFHMCINENERKIKYRWPSLENTFFLDNLEGFTNVVLCFSNSLENHGLPLPEIF